MTWKLVTNDLGKYFTLKRGKVNLYVTTRDGLDPLKQEGITENPINLHQIHSDRVYFINRYFPGSGVDGDGLITFEPGLWIAVKTADCYPVFIFDEGGKVASVVHAGWRGTVKRIAQKAVKMILKETNLPPDKLIVAFGPGISGENYEIGEDVAKFFYHGIIRKNGKIYLDLLKENIVQLRDAGISKFIYPPGDTYSSPLFYSFRKDKMIKGLIWSIIGIGGNHGKNH